MHPSLVPLRFFIITTSAVDFLKGLYCLLYAGAYFFVQVWTSLFYGAPKIWIRTSKSKNGLFSLWEPGLSDLDLTVEFPDETPRLVDRFAQFMAFHGRAKRFLPFMGELECLTTSELDLFQRLGGDPLAFRKNFVTLKWLSVVERVVQPSSALLGNESQKRNRFNFLQYVWNVSPRYHSHEVSPTRLKKIVLDYEQTKLDFPELPPPNCFSSRNLPHRRIENAPSGRQLQKDLCAILEQHPSVQAAVWPFFGACERMAICFVSERFNRGTLPAPFRDQYTKFVNKHQASWSSLLPNPPIQIPLVLDIGEWNQFLLLFPWEAMVLNQLSISEGSTEIFTEPSRDALLDYIYRDFSNLLIEKNDLCGYPDARASQLYRQILFKVTHYTDLVEGNLSKDRLLQTGTVAPSSFDRARNWQVLNRKVEFLKNLLVRGT